MKKPTGLIWQGMQSRLSTALGLAVLTCSVAAGVGLAEPLTTVETRTPQADLTLTRTTAQPPSRPITAWNWISVLAVPVSLAIFACWLYGWQRVCAERQAKLDQQMALINQREKALQAYFTQLSNLLVEQNLIAMAATVLPTDTEAQTEDSIDFTVLEQQAVFKTVMDVIRGRTLSILRMLGEDGERKGEVIRFLIESEVMSALRLDLSRANLSQANLQHTNLKNANLTEADLSGANLDSAVLENANLKEANLSQTNLNHAQLKNANLRQADLVGASLLMADLSNVNFTRAALNHACLNGANLEKATLTAADLSHASLKSANLTQSNLSSIKLDWTDLSSGGLTRAYVSRDPLAMARLCHTILPDGTVSNRDCQPTAQSQSYSSQQAVSATPAKEIPEHPTMNPKKGGNEI